MKPYLKTTPTRDGFFGDYGGAMLPPPLVPHFQGRPTPISYLKNLSEMAGGAQIYAKREDLNTAAHLQYWATMRPR